MATLGDFITTQKGYAFKSAWYTGEGHPIVKVSDFTADSVDPDNLVCVPDEIAIQYQRYSLSTGDVVVQTVGSWPSNPASVVGKAIRVPRTVNGALLNQNAVKIEPHELLDKGYLYYLLRGDEFKEYIVGTAQGAASQASITLDSIRGYKFVLPSIERQQEIANVLSTYDNLIENNNRRIAILEEMAQSLYREWFVKFRFPGHENAKFIDSPLGKIPEGWEVVTVEELVKRYQTGKKYNNKTARPEGEVPILDQGKSGVIGYHNDEPGVVATEDDPIIVFANHTCYQKIIHYPFSAIQNVLPFKSIGGGRDRDLYWLHFATKDVIEFNDYKGHWPEFVAKKIVLAAKELCSSFGVLVKPIERQKYKLECQAAMLKKHRDLILPKLISGSIQV